MYDDQQRRIEALRRLAQEQLRAQQPTQPSAVVTPAPARADDAELVVEPLTSRASEAQGLATASTRMSRSSRRGLAWILIGAVALLALVLAGTFGLQRVLPATTPTATPITGNELIVTSNFNSGSVSLNGKKVDGALPVLVRLKPGENTITFSAPPFRDRTCNVTLLAQIAVGSRNRVQSAGDRCDVGSSESPPTLNGVTARNGFLVFEMTGADLPTEAHNAAETALWARLTKLPTFQVPAGEYYATGVDSSGRIRSARAGIPLVASPTLFRVSTAPQNAEYCPNLSCPGAPVLPGQPGAAGVTIPSGVWVARESVAQGWRFTTLGGALVATAPERDGLSVQAGLAYSPTAGWSVVDGAPGPFLTDLQSQVTAASCQFGFFILQDLVGKSPLAGQQLSYGQNGQNGNGGATAQTDGCALKLEAQNSNPFSPNGGNKQYGHYVWRWGVLLAADAQARALLPFLPSAPQSEITAVGGIDF